MGKTSIEWANYTFNPWRGCTKVHTGCANCYAENDLSVKLHGIKWGPNGTRVVKAESGWREPLKWNADAAKAGERRRVFCASLADVFEDWSGPVLDVQRGPLWINQRGTQSWEFDDGSPGFAFEKRWAKLDDVRKRLFALIDATPNLDWMLLTKRPENVRRMWTWPKFDNPLSKQRPNVWLGTSVSDQETADQWIPELLKLRDLTPVLFVSAEPLLGPIELLYPPRLFPNGPQMCCDGRDCGCRGMPTDPWPWFYPRGEGIDLVIVGGESGPHARPCNYYWVKSLVDQCAATQTACFVKQWGAKPYFDSQCGFRYDDHTHHKLGDPKGGDMNEWPEVVRVRQMPIAQHTV